VEAAQGKPIKLHKYIAYHTSANDPPHELRARTARTLDRATKYGFEPIERHQREFMEDFWKRSDIETSASSVHARAQQCIRWNLFQLCQATARVEGAGVPAKGLTGQAYEGHYFWDMEIYVMPFLIYTAPRIARNLLQGRDELGYSVSATTRPMREGEREGVDYHFLTREEFLRRRAAGEFLESATYGGHLYGTLRSEIDRIFAGGRHAVLDIEIEGARQIRATFPNSLHLFVLPPSAEVLIGRLRGRNTEPAEAVRERIARAVEELDAVAEYDYVVVNQDLVIAVAQVAAILDAEARRVSRQSDLPQVIARLRRDVAAAVEKI
jgi:guanylate kinase